MLSSYSFTNELPLLLTSASRLIVHLSRVVTIRSTVEVSASAGTASILTSDM